MDGSERHSTQRNKAQQVPPQADVADMVEAATELLRLTGSASGPEEMFHQILSVTSDVEAAFTAALSVLDESLTLATCQDKRITVLEKEQARLQPLAIFTDRIEVFRDFVAGLEDWACILAETGQGLICRALYGIKACTSRSGQCPYLYGSGPICLGWYQAGCHQGASSRDRHASQAAQEHGEQGCVA